MHKALYGLKQTPCAWYQKIHAYLVAHGFKNSPTESTLYVYKDGADLLILNLYVDDLLVTGPNEEKISAFIADLQHAFDVTDLGLLHYYLGIQFLHVEGGIWLSQQRYIEKLLMRFGMADCKPISTPMETGVVYAFDVATYRQVGGCLIHLCMTRFDIRYVVSQFSKFMHV